MPESGFSFRLMGLVARHMTFRRGVKVQNRAHVAFGPIKSKYSKQMMEKRLETFHRFCASPSPSRRFPFGTWLSSMSFLDALFWSRTTTAIETQAARKACEFTLPTLSTTGSHYHHDQLCTVSHSALQFTPFDEMKIVVRPITFSFRVASKSQSVFDADLVARKL